MIQTKELDANFKIIEQNRFFEHKKSKGTQLQANLSTSIKEQHKSSLSTAYAAKYARIWLEKVRERRQQRAIAEEENKN